MIPELRLEFDGVEALEAAHKSDLAKGRAFVPGAGGVAERQACRLILVHPESGATLDLAAEAVWVKLDEPGRGVGVALQRFDDAAREALAAFVAARGPALAEPADEPVGRNIHERVRALSARERDALARQGAVAERVALERAFGGSVWEGILQNPQVTVQEVARIAKNGTLPTPLVNLVIGNGGWLANAEVQRALLGNARVNGQHLDRVLRALSRSEIERVAATGGGYRADVKTAARRLTGKA